MLLHLEENHNLFFFAKKTIAIMKRKETSNVSFDERINVDRLGKHYSLLLCLTSTVLRSRVNPYTDDQHTWCRQAFGVLCWVRANITWSRGFDGY